jgi:hypothetical protein
LVLYDVTTLHFERGDEDELRKGRDEQGAPGRPMRRAWTIFLMLMPVASCR